MGRQVEPEKQLRFGGVDTSGHPLERPKDSATKCENFRVMRGGWLQTRGGYKARLYQSPGAYVQQITKDRLVQYYDGTNHKWAFITTDPWVINPFAVTTISGEYDGDFAATEPVAWTIVNRKAVLYNGLGVRDETDSKPPFTSWGDDDQYFGLDAYCPDGNPTVAFTAGAGYNRVLDSLDVYVGLYNEQTGHYSNGVFCGTITSTGTYSGTIALSDLDNLTYAYRNNGEMIDLNYVFYVTIDGGKVPYLILNAAGTDTHTRAVTNTTASLSLIADADGTGLSNGFYRDLTAEMPIDNFPARPMRDIVYLNGRIYGVLMPGGDGDAVMQTYPDGSKKADFTYTASAKYYAGIVYSKSAADIASQHTVGLHDESWPLTNFSATPNSERPTKIAEAPDGYRLLVLCPESTYLVYEANDGLHEWSEVSLIHGIANKRAFANTDYGAVWVTQRNQLAILEPDSEKPRILSLRNQHLFKGKTVQFCKYWLDPLNEVDQIHVYFTDGNGVVYDFVTGESYSFTNMQFRCGGTFEDQQDRMQYVLANRDVVSHLGQIVSILGDSGTNDHKIITYDESFAVGGNSTTTESIAGTYVSQWMDFGDDSQRKELPHLDLVADENTEVEWFGDFEEKSAINTRPTSAGKRAQSETDGTFRYKLNDHSKTWYKFQMKLTADGTKEYYDAPTSQGDLAGNFYGGIYRGEFSVARRGNRP